MITWESPKIAIFLILISQAILSSVPTGVISALLLE